MKEKIQDLLRAFKDRDAFWAAADICPLTPL